MKQPRMTILSSMVGIAYLGGALGSMRAESPVWRSVRASITVGILLAAGVTARLRRGASSCFGFALFGWLTLLCGLDRGWTGLGLPSNWLIVWLADAMYLSGNDARHASISERPLFVGKVMGRIHAASRQMPRWERLS